MEWFLGGSFGVCIVAGTCSCGSEVRIRVMDVWGCGRKSARLLSLRRLDRTKMTMCGMVFSGYWGLTCFCAVTAEQDRASCI